MANVGFRPIFIALDGDELDKSPKPTEDEVKRGISGNLCRCTGYTKIIEAIMAT